jgi:arylsulfatase A-like enzyme
MSDDKKTRINLEWVRKLIYRNKLISSIASKPWYLARKDKRLVNARIRSLNLSPYIDTSSNPVLNVIIIVIDELRNVSMSCNGYFRETTPFLNSIKTRFKAISASSWTYPSVASLLTGLYPHNHGAMIGGTIRNIFTDTVAPLRSNAFSLPEIIHFIGYKTHFYTANEFAYLALRTRVMAHRYRPVTAAETLLRNLRKCIRRGAQRQFAYVHLADLHTPYAVPDRYSKFFGYDRNSQQKQLVVSQTMYDNALRYVDTEIARLFDYLSDSRLLDHTVVVITADHGEAFGEHSALEFSHFYYPKGFKGFGHGHNVFQEVIEVPLIFAGAVPADVTTNNLVSLVDIVPSVLDLLGVKHRFRFDGRSVFANTGLTELRPLLSEACAYGYERKALIIGSQKLIYSKEDNIAWVFDLEKDPLERNPITDPEVTSPLVNNLQMILQEDERLRIREARKRIKM